MLGQLKLDQVCQEIIGSCQVIAEITGNKPVPFAFPYQSLGIDRQLLKKIYQKNDFVGLFFDTNGILPYEDFIVDRIWADAPEWNLGRSTLPDLLHLTYQNMLLEKMRKLGVYQ